MIPASVIRAGLALAVGFALAAGASGAEIELPAPAEIELYPDGARFRYRLELPAGEHRVRLPANAGAIGSLRGARVWNERHRQVGVEAPALPERLVELASAVDALAAEARLLAARDQLRAGLEGTIAQRLPIDARRAEDRVRGWQASVDHLIDEQAVIDRTRAELDAAYAALLVGTAGWPAEQREPGGILGLRPRLDPDTAPDLGPGAVSDRWRAAGRGSDLERILDLALSADGAVELVLERDDLRWIARARLLVAAGAARLIRQGELIKPADLALAAVRLRLHSGAMDQILDGPQAPTWRLASREVAADELETISTGWREVGWDDQPVDPEAVARESSRSVNWALTDVRLPADTERVPLELASGPVALLGDEWFLVQGRDHTARRRIGVALDQQPLLAGPLEIVVDGVAIGSQRVGFQVPGATLHLLAGEDQRLFVTGTEAWPQDPNQPPNRLVRGWDWTLRNLGEEAIAVTLYRSGALSATDALAVGPAAETSPGGEEVRPGLWRWRVTIPAGDELVHRFGIEASADEPITW